METMKLTEKKKSSKGVVIGLLLFFIIGGAILYLGLKMEEEPEVVGTSTDNTETQSLVDVDKANKDELTKKNQSIEYSVTDKSIKDSSNAKMKAKMTLPVISIEGEELSSINSEINKYYTDMFNSLKEQMASASSKYTYTVTYNVYENMIEENKVISITIYERIVDDSAKKNTMNKIKTYNIDAATKEQITQSNNIAQILFGKDYKTIIRNSIKDYVVSNKMMKESDFNYTYTGVKPFYIKEGKLHLIFNEGELVDSKYGVLDITINN